MRLRELWGIPIPGTEKAVGLKKVSKKLMGKVRTYYEPVVEVQGGQTSLT